MNPQPRITLAMPTIGRSAMLRQSLHALLHQSDPDFSLTVVDNVSQDDTPAVVAAIQDPRMRYVRFEQRLPVFANWNRAMGLLDGDVIGIVHDDDIYHPRFIELVRRAYRENPGLALFHGKAARFQGERLAPDFFAQPSSYPLVVQDGLEFSRRLVSRLKSLYIATAMVSGARWRKLPGFDERWGFVGDAVAMAKLAETGTVAYCPIPLTAYRDHPMRETHKYDRGKNLEEYLVVLEEIYGGHARREFRRLWPRTKRRASFSLALCMCEAFAQGRIEDGRRKLRVLQEHGGGAGAALLVRLVARDGGYSPAVANAIWNMRLRLRQVASWLTFEQPRDAA